MRRSVEPVEDALPHSKRARAPREEPRRQGRLHDRQAKSTRLRHDDASGDRHWHQAPAHAQGAGLSTWTVGKGDVAYGPAAARTHLHVTCFRCSRKCVRSSVR